MRAFVVLGPVSSGTKLITKLLIKAGCKGSDKHNQPWDKKLPYDDELIVWRRSVPHRKWEMPAIRWMVTQLKDRGYETTAVITSRDWYPMAKSIVLNHPPDTLEAAYESIQAAYPYIFDHLGDTPYEMVSYEALVLNAEDVLEELFNRLGLLAPKGVDIYNGNEKHYAD